MQFENDALIARAFLREHGVYRYRMKKVSDMSDKEVIGACHSWCAENGLAEEYGPLVEAQYPHWYWVYGLRKPQILGIDQLILEPNWKADRHDTNCLEIRSEGTDVEKIRLFNYKILSGSLPDVREGKVWWCHDRLTARPDRSYCLQIVFGSASGDEIKLEVVFEAAEVEYKHEY